MSHPHFFEAFQPLHRREAKLSTEYPKHLKSLPILLIDEYDVHANHGAAIGKMSDDELFYLMSRGLSNKEAFKLILSGIINPFMDNLLDESLCDEISSSIYSLI